MLGDAKQGVAIVVRVICDGFVARELLQLAHALSEQMYRRVQPEQSTQQLHEIEQPRIALTVMLTFVLNRDPQVVRAQEQ